MVSSTAVGGAAHIYIKDLIRNIGKKHRISLTGTFCWNYWVFRLSPSSVILKSREHNILETGSVSVLR
jgi:hypothetical protein